MSKYIHSFCSGNNIGEPLMCKLKDKLTFGLQIYFNSSPSIKQEINLSVYSLQCNVLTSNLYYVTL